MPFPTPAAAVAADEGVADGLGTLGPDGKQALAERPLSAVYCLVVHSNAAMLAATRPDGSAIQAGDYLDNDATGQTYVWTYQGNQNGGGHSNLANWHQGSLAGAAVASVGHHSGLEDTGTTTAPNLGINRTEVDGWYDEAGAASDAELAAADYTDSEVAAHLGDATLTQYLTNPVNATWLNFTGCDVRYLPLPKLVDTFYEFKFPIPQGIGSVEVWAMIYKVSGPDGSVTFSTSSLSDPSSQMAAGDQLQGPSPYLNSTGQALPTGSTIAVRQTITSYHLGAVQLIETSASVGSIKVGRLSNPATTDHDSYANDIGLAWVELRGTRTP